LAGNLADLSGVTSVMAGGKQKPLVQIERAQRGMWEPDLR
jgi:hypothetical protein